MPEPIEVGEIFANQRVLAYAGNGFYRCQCSTCDAVTTIPARSLRLKRCVCLHPVRTPAAPVGVIVGRVYGSLRTIEQLDGGRWLCRCERCGFDQFTASAHSLKTGKIKLCGACYAEKKAARLNAVAPIRVAVGEHGWEMAA